MISLKAQAIEKAFEGNWKAAILLNKELLKENPKDIETLNRLALAFSVTGKTKEAKSTYEQVLKIDNQNPIASKNIKRLSIQKPKGKNGTALVLNQDISSMFLEESGKTKVIELINIAEPKVILRLMTAEMLTLQIKRLKLFVLDAKNQYIGVLPDDIGKRLIKFIKGGNTYKICVKATGTHRIAVFIRETKRAGRFKNQPSFSQTEKTKMVLLPKNHLKDSEEDDGDEADDAE